MITIKSPEEIAVMKEAGKILAGTLKYIKEQIKAGKKTEVINKLVEDYILDHGATPSFKGYRGYKYATCLSINEQVVHGVPGSRELMPGDIVGVDAGVYYKGLHVDKARTYAIGEVSAEAKKLMAATRAGLKAGLAQAKAGIKLGAISHAIEAVANEHGYAVVRDLFGHGIGKDLHEEPLIPNFGLEDQGPELKAGMTFAIEPMFNCGTYEIKTLKDGWTVVTADGKLSAHFEDTILIKKEGCEVLT